ncbi:hypothetical protein DSO57_1014024 [Entomophthora muscae]|uniref:Uncharacterized protein n=1 Tax=Entomophthora muscae TaxID=34485 RepID=A0ACC2T5G0_9FUNG|nr:hypothetical protein DSO57_1014024 [Entomophthora muscae]
MNHLIFSAVLMACLGISGHQYNQQHGPFNNSSGKYYYKEPAQVNSSKWYSWLTLVLPHSTQSVAIYTCIYYVITYLPNCNCCGEEGHHFIYYPTFCAPEAKASTSEAMPPKTKYSKPKKVANASSAKDETYLVESLATVM